MAKGKAFAHAGKLIDMSQYYQKPSEDLSILENFSLLRAEGFDLKVSCPECQKFHSDYNKQLEKCILRYFKRKRSKI